MSATKFIAELERRRLLSERLMTKLRDSIAGSDRPLSAEALAKFLVQKKQLSEQQAREVLNGLSQSGVNLMEEDAESKRESPEDSSIFAANITGSRKKNKPEPPKTDDDEILLVPLEDEAVSAKKKQSVAPDDDLPVLGVVPAAKEPATRKTKPSSPPPVIELGDEAGSNTLTELEPNATTAGVSEAVPTVRRTSGLSRGKKKSKTKRKSAAERKRWDSPLILIGGGGLSLLLIVGGALWWLLGRESGDDRVEQANASFKGGAFAQAIDQYESFLKDYPRHAQHSRARVNLALVRIRMPTEAGDFPAALTAAENELKAVEDEEAFKDADVKGDIASLLPQIAQGLATAAEKADPTSEDAKKFTDLSNKALALCNNAAYIPKSLRVEAKFVEVQDTLDRAARRQQSQLALAEGLKTIEQAATDKKPIAAYAAHMKLLKEHPELTGDAKLVAAIQKTTTAEQAAVKFVKEAKAAETAERQVPWRAALAVANRRVKPAAPLNISGIACFQADGAIYAMEAATGRLVWRRQVGFGSGAPPMLIDRDVLITDASHSELLRVEAASNRLVWRQTIGEPFIEPLVAGERALVPAKSGKLYVIDLKTGGRSGYLRFAQPLAVSPTIDRQKLRIYAPGEQGSVYSVSLTDMKCIGVTYLGHSAGSIKVPAAAVMDKVAIIENDGVETSRLHLMSLDDKGAIGKQVAERRLNGLAASPPITTGRGMIVVTDRGQIEVYDIATGSAANALTVVANRDPTSKQPLVRYIAVTGRNVWIADTQLTKFSIIPTGNRLPVQEIENNFAGATFSQPMVVLGDALIHIRRPKDRAGYVVTASDTKQGHPLWETDLAIPPAGAPVVDEANKSMTVATAEGYVFYFDEAAIRSRVQDEPIAAALMPAELPALSGAVDLGQGRAVFCAPGANQLLVYNSAQGAGAKWVTLESPLACNPTRLGDGFIAPLKIGQVFYLSSADGSRLATPFQPRLEPQASLAYKPAAAVGNDGRQFVISDGKQKIYVVQRADQPQPHLEEVKQGDVGPNAIESPVVVLGDTALAVAGGTHLLRFKIPTLETTGDSNLPAPLEWGPYQAGDSLLVATADDKLLCISASGDVKWQMQTQHGAFAGPPLVLPDGVVIVYRKGIIERRSLTDGKAQASANLEQPIATGPALFLQRLVVASSDGTLLVVDKP
jgi:outer membrane protein assembly factor BamB